MLASKINIGELDRRVTIQYKETSTNDTNEEVIDSWEDLRTVWAKVRMLQGNESVEGERLTANQTAVFTIRYLSTVTVQMRIVFGGFAYQIKSIMPNGLSRNRYLDVAAELIDNEVVS